MKENPASSIALRLGAESIPTSATTTIEAMPGPEGGEHGDQGSGRCIVSFEHVNLQWEPARIDQEPDLDLRVDPVLLANPQPTRVILLAVLEMQRVGPARGAVTALLLCRFPGLPAVPAVRLSPRRALHEDGAVERRSRRG